MIDPDAEVAKYDALYALDKTYRMGETRKAAVKRLLVAPPDEDCALLDVGSIVTGKQIGRAHV